MSKNTLDTVPSPLLQRARKGEQSAYKELYSQYSRAMFNISYRITCNRDEAEDVLQESFLKAFQNLSKFENENALGGWLKRVVINGSIDMVRRRKETFVGLDETPDIEAEEDIHYDVDTLRACILELPDNYRVVLTLFLFEEHSHKEIAALLNITENTSKSQYHRARKKLLQLIKEKKHEY